jgi:hypothetical protein
MMGSAASETKLKFLQQLSVQDAGLGILAGRIFGMFSQWQSVSQKGSLQGLRTAYFLRGTMSKTFDRHASLERPILADHIAHLCRMIELLKAIEQTFFLNQSRISHNLPVKTDLVLGTLRTQIDL